MYLARCPATTIGLTYALQCHRVCSFKSTESQRASRALSRARERASSRVPLHARELVLQEKGRKKRDASFLSRALIDAALNSEALFIDTRNAIAGSVLCTVHTEPDNGKSIRSRVIIRIAKLATAAKLRVMKPCLSNRTSSLLFFFRL